MNLHWKRNGFRLKYQIILTIGCNVDTIGSVESELIKDIVRIKATKPNLRVLTVNCGPRWIEILVDADPGIDPTRFVSVTKAEISAQLKSLRKSTDSIWIPGYVVTTLGDLLSADDAAKELARRQSGTRNRSEG